MQAIMTTFTGRCVDVFDLHVNDFSIRDIAHHLALINRFCGATYVPMSVAQHCVGVSKLCHPKAALQGLLHDSPEAYLGDVIKWLKRHASFQFYRDKEAATQNKIFVRYGATNGTGAFILDSSVEEADRLIVRYEASRLMRRSIDVPNDQQAFYPECTSIEIDSIQRKLGKWEAWSWQEAEEKFLERFRDLTEG